MKIFNIEKLNKGKKVEKFLLLFKIFRYPLLLVAKLIRKNQKDSSIILISDGFLIGDSVLLRPLVKAANRKYNKTILISGKHTPIIYDDMMIDWIDFQYPWANYKYNFSAFMSLFKLWYKIFTIQPKVIVETRGDLRSLLFLYMACPQKLAGYSFTGGKKLLDIEPAGMENIEHLEMHNSALALSLEMNYQTSDVRKKIYIANRKQKRIGLHFDSSQRTRILPRFMADKIIKILKKKTNYEIVYISGPTGFLKDNPDFISANAIQEYNCGLDNFVHYISDLSVYIGVDSAGAHIASMYEIPSLIFFSVYNSNYSMPIANPHLVTIETDEKLECRPCGGNKCINPNYQRCLTGINDMELEKKIETVLSHTQKKRSFF